VATSKNEHCKTLDAGFQDEIFTFINHSQRLPRGAINCIDVFLFGKAKHELNWL
jgi:hypothetical protein